eukprot:2802246-Pleurochrysis_carterae.AAC.1
MRPCQLDHNLSAERGASTFRSRVVEAGSSGRSSCHHRARVTGALSTRLPSYQEPSKSQLELLP